MFLLQYTDYIYFFQKNQHILKFFNKFILNLYLSSISAVPQNAKKYIQDIGKYLVSTFGKKEFYKPKEVLKALENVDYKNIHEKWAMSIFVSHSSFDEYFRKNNIDYRETRKQMLEKMTNTKADFSFVSDLALDISWLSFENIFDNILEGIGGIVSGIFD